MELGVDSRKIIYLFSFSFIVDYIFSFLKIEVIILEYYPSFSDSLRADIQPSYKDSIMHHGIKGMHWGVRRFEDESGHLTPAGKKRYSLNPFVRAKQKKEDKKKAEWDALPEQEKIRRTNMKNMDTDWDNLTYDFFDQPSSKKMLDNIDKLADESDTSEGYAKFQKAHDSFRTKQANYVSKNLLDKYGRDWCDQYADYSSYPSGKTFEDRCAKYFRDWDLY